MIPVILETPYGTRLDGTRCTPEEIAGNVGYAKACMRECLERGEAPFASHLLYTQVYDDANSVERERGMQAGFAWGECLAVGVTLHGDRAHYPVRVVVYDDYGVTAGMASGIERAKARGSKVIFRKLGTR